MKLVRPSWLGHRDENRTFEVYSLDASPDNARLVTGGLDSKVKVWATEGIAHPDDATRPRLLASMSAHTGAVTAVAFSPDGRFIASGSDDRIVLVSELDRTRQPRQREFGSAGDGAGGAGAELVESEVWTPRKRLVGHDNDVQDLAWSPDGQLLVSVGLDSAIIVWSGTTFEKLKRLDWHQSHVKGVAFDPANKFFVTCSDDRTARVVRYSRASPTELSFSVETIVSSPFTDSPLTSYFRRCSWSPDGETIACPNATNGPIPTVAVIDRGQWAAPKNRQISLVGHEGTTEVARFSPRLYGESTCVVATAGEDSAVAVWSTSDPRPLFVVQNVANKLITDLAWSRSGLQLYAASLDGSVVLIEFGPTDLGRVMPLDEAIKRLEKYSNATDLMDIPQSTEQIGVQLRAQQGKTKPAPPPDASAKPAAKQEGGATPSASAPSTSASSTSAPSASKPLATDAAHTTTSAVGDGGGATNEGSATSEAGSSTKTERRGRSLELGSASAKAGEQSKAAAATLTANDRQNSGGPADTAGPAAAAADSPRDAAAAGAAADATEETAATTAPAAPGDGAAGNGTAGAGTNSATALAAVPAPVRAARVAPATSRAETKQKMTITKDGRKRLTPMLLNASGPGAPPAPLQQLQQQSRDARASPLFSHASTGFAVYDRPSNALPAGGISTLVVGNKRKSDDDPAPPKRTKEDLTYLRPVVLNPSTTVSQIRLATPRVVSHLSSDPDCAAVLEARNASHAGEPTRISLVARGHTVFFDFIAEYASLIAGAVDYFWAVASETGVVYVYTPHGSRALPPLVLGAPVALLESNKQYLCALTATGVVHAWDMVRQTALFPPQSIGPCLDTGMKFQENGLVKAPQVTQCWITDQGHLLLAVTSGSVFHFDARLHAWERVSESFWAYGSQHWDSTGLRHGKTQGCPIAQAELRTNEEALLKAGARGRQLQRQAVNRTVQAGYQGFEEAVAVAHLGTRVVAARIIESPELPKFTHQLVRKLAARGERQRLSELFRSLTPELLQSALDVAAEYKGAQTLVAEYR